MSARKRVVILGAAGRDFHDFNVRFRDDATVEVVAFTASQIPRISGRVYPAGLAGPAYPRGIPILPERELEAVVARERVHEVVLSYSDLSHVDVMHLASRALAAGASFRLLAPADTMLQSHRPVAAVTAVRTGCGKSQASRYVAQVLRECDLRVVVVRHPMPYGDLAAMRVQRFATLEDLARWRGRMTIEELEEYEPHVTAGSVVYAGVDYGAVLAQADAEADVIVWDGGNNDVPFFRPSTWITLVDPHRAGHESTYHPGETNLRSADIIVVAKVDSAPAGSVERVRATIAAVNPSAKIVETDSRVTVDDPTMIAGKRVVVVEDGPSLTHGGLATGAGHAAARAFGAREIVDPRSFAVGSIRALYDEWPHLGPVVPAMGYYGEQLAELETTLSRAPCDVVVIGTPIDLRRVVDPGHPSVRARYELTDRTGATLRDEIRRLALTFDREPPAVHRRS